MKTSVFITGLVISFAFMATATLGAPSSIGPSGIMNMPTAETVAADSFELLLGYDSLKVADERINVIPVAALAYGLPNGEIGVSYFNADGYTAVKGAHAKYVIARRGDGAPQVSAGVIYLSGDTAETDLYLVASDNLGAGDRFRATFGILHQNPNLLEAGSNTTGMVGMEFGTPGGMTFGLDYIFHDIAAGEMLGATVHVPVTSNLTLQVGAGNYARYFIGLAMEFGGR